MSLDNKKIEELDIDSVDMEDFDIGEDDTFDISDEDLAGIVIDDDEEYQDSSDANANTSDNQEIELDIEDDDIGDLDDTEQGEADSFDIEIEDESGSANVDNQEASDDDELARLTAEIAKFEVLTSTRKEIDDFDNDDSFDNLDPSTLMDTDDDYESFEVAQKGKDFISDTGEIVVMDPDDSGENFKLIYVDIEKIAIAKRIRSNNNVDDLVKSIKSTGLLKPVDVAPASAVGYYVLLDGYRRILACARAGKRNIPCVVNTRVNTPEIPILEAMYNHSKKYSIKEIIDYIDYLEKEKGIMSASMIEYLLQLNSGEYTKLKDILNDNDDDIVSKMMDGLFTIDQAFKKLEQRRKKESAEVKELKKATRVYEEDPESGVEIIDGSGETSDGEELSEEELSRLAINASNFDDCDEQSLGEMIESGKNMDGFKPRKQDPKYRERLEPTLRKAVLARDNNTCRVCKMISGMEFTEVLDVHHVHEVYLGGDDDIDNLITACTVCHKLIHLYARGELNIRPVTEMSEAEEARFKRIVNLGLTIRVDMKNKNMSKEDLKKIDNAGTIGRTKPGTGQEAG